MKPFDHFTHLIKTGLLILVMYGTIFTRNEIKNFTSITMFRLLLEVFKADPEGNKEDNLAQALGAVSLAGILEIFFALFLDFLCFTILLILGLVAYKLLGINNKWLT
jgi:hypothetical protein